MWANSSREVGRANEEYGKEMGNPIKEGAAKKKFRGKISFCGVDYPTLDTLKAIFKALIVKTKNGAVIEEPGHTQVLNS